MRVELPRSLVNRILTHAQASGEHEVCGLMAARDGHPTRIYPIANVAEAPDRLFRMDPEEQIAAMRHMRAAGERLFAIYHSHPTAPATPSPRDLAEAAYPDALFLIVSLNTEGVLEMRGFYLRNGTAEEVALVIKG